MRYGHFDNELQEYVVDRVDLPASWINYLGTRDLCTVINQNAGGYSFYRSSERGRVTRFRPNGVPLDRPGHYVYVRDDEAEDYWSISWQPVGKPLDGGVGDPGEAGEPGEAGRGQAGHGQTGTYRARHGLGYSIFESTYRGIEASQRVFIPLDEDVEIWDVTVRNTGDTERRISLFSYVEFSFHSVRIDQENFQMSLYAAGADYDDGIIEDDFYYEPWTYHYHTATRRPDGFDALRDAFIGPYRSETNPIAVERGECSGSQGTTQNHCGALHHRLTLAPGQSVRLAYLLGYGRRAVGAQVRDRFAADGAVDAAFEALIQHWRSRRQRLTVATPSADFNQLVGTWTLYQAETCVVWSRFASFVEVGGRVGLGYRDTAQDIMAVPHTNPAAVRRRIMELLRGQMAEGYGLHLFDPMLFEENQRPDIPVGVKLPTVVPTSAAGQLHGLADACSDDHLWLVASVLEYVKETGQIDFLRQSVRFADDGAASVYEHLIRAVDFTDRQVAANGVALGLRADWNDCLNLGGGQSALVCFLHVWAARCLAEAADALGQAADAARLRAMAERVSAVANRELWDGRWYLRGFTGAGAKIGSAEAAEGKIFLEHQPWAIISGLAPRQRGLAAMDSIQTHLASPYGTHLVWPAYSEVDDSIGYVTRVYPGVKENAAIFCHPNAWPIIAETMLGRGEAAWSFYESMAPSRFNDAIEVRGAEPYVYCQFIYGRDHELFGKAQNPWLTGTAGWMYTAATHYILGIRPEFDALTVDPCIPAAWDGFEATRQWRGGTYHIEVRNPDHVNAGVARIEIDGAELAPVPDPATGRLTARLPIPTPGATHQVLISLG